MSEPSESLTIGIDIGGTKVAGGVVDPGGRVLTLTSAETPASDVIRTRGVIIDMIRELAAAYPVTAAGIGAAGWIDASGDTIRFAPHLAWRDEPLRELVAAAVGMPVVVENDANAAAWAEYKFGAAREPSREFGDAAREPNREFGGAAREPSREFGGAVREPSRELSGAGRGAGDSMVLVAVGTGIGGGLVLGGQLVRGAHGYAGEPGHQQLVPDGLPCTCGRRGCLEQYASGKALVRLAKAGAAEQPSAAAGLLELAAADGGQITGPLVTTAARAGDKLAREAFDQVGRWLGVGLADLVQVLDPHLIVIGGGVAEAGELLMAPVRESYREELGQRGQLAFAPVRPARLGNIAGLIGAADLARLG